MYDFKYLPTLPGLAYYQAWVKERLETLSVREGYILAAVLQGAPPRDVEEAVYCLDSLKDCDIRPAGSYEELGKYYFQRLKAPEDVLSYADLDQLGRQYEDKHPGLFIGHCYVVYPKQPIPRESWYPQLWDEGWSVKLKLASSTVPDGVWLRLPDYARDSDYGVGEIDLALHELRVKSLDDCTLLEAQCILPEAGDLTAQYSSVSELARDGNDLGHILDKQDQGELYWLEKISDVLKYEGCHTLKFALDILQNMHCYEWVLAEDLTNFAANHLRDKGVPEELIQSGAIDLKDYAGELLEASGYTQTSDKIGYITRNSREFIREYSEPKPHSTIQLG